MPIAVLTFSDFTTTNKRNRVCASIVSHVSTCPNATDRERQARVLDYEISRVRRAVKLLIGLQEESNAIIAAFADDYYDTAFMVRYKLNDNTTLLLGGFAECPPSVCVPCQRCAR